MNFDQIIELFANHSIQGLLLAIGAAIFWILDNLIGFPRLISRFFYKVFEIVLRRKIDSNDGSGSSYKIISESDITNHDIFNYLNFWIYSKIPTFEFSSEFRTVVFRKYLTIYLKKHKEIFKRFISEKSFTEMNDTQLWNTFLSIINEIIYDYETEMMATGIPRIIIEKMKSKNNERISLTIDLIEGICNSSFYHSDKNYLKVYSILNIYLAVLENTITGSIKICDSINGQLKGMSMDGKTEP
jgi:hypothetical protein